jgi:DNA polymerase III epsilon subunit-like protein
VAKHSVPLLVAIDTETTGLGHKDSPPRSDGVVQVGIAWRDTVGELQIWERTCNPGPEFLQGGRAGRALEVSGLTPEAVLAAPSAKLVAAELRAQLGALAATAGAIELRAFNRAFDEPFLTVAPWSLTERWGPCVMIASYERFGGVNPGRIPLWKALQEARVESVHEAHRAGADAAATLLLLEAISPKTLEPVRRLPRSLGEFG